jgi:hypothetical protein
MSDNGREWGEIAFGEFLETKAVIRGSPTVQCIKRLKFCFCARMAVASTRQGSHDSFGLQGMEERERESKTEGGWPGAKELCAPSV